MVSVIIRQTQSSWAETGTELGKNPDQFVGDHYSVVNFLVVGILDLPPPPPPPPHLSTIVGVNKNLNKYGGEKFSKLSEMTRKMDENLMSKSKDDNLKGRWTNTKTTAQETNLKGRWPHTKTTLQEDNLKGIWTHLKTHSQNDDITWRQLQRKTTIQENNLQVRQEDDFSYPS